MNTATVFNVQRFSLHDGPGIRTTVFLKGCPLRCPWCHNPESIDPRPEPALKADRCLGCDLCTPVCGQGLTGRLDLSPTDHRPTAACERCGACAEACPAEARTLLGRTVTVEELLTDVVRDRAFFEASGGGVTFSGGEPLAAPHAPFVMDCLEDLRRQDVPTALDTCGHVDGDTLLAAARLTDLVLFDLKIMDDHEHRRVCGVGTERIHANLRAVAGLGVEVRVRVPLIPGLTDDAANLSAIGAFVTGLPQPPAVHLLPYHTTGGDKYGRLGRGYELAEVAAPGPEDLDRAARTLTAHGLNVMLGG